MGPDSKCARNANMHPCHVDLIKQHDSILISNRSYLLKLESTVTQRIISLNRMTIGSFNWKAGLPSLDGSHIVIVIALPFIAIAMPPHVWSYIGDRF